jgi:hypothetical protein
MGSLFSKSKLEAVKSYLELVKYLVEITAIIVAGLWAYSKFVEVEKPMQLRTSSTSDLGWYRTPKEDTCMGRLGVTIKNIGTKPFHIDKVIVQAWIVDKSFLSQTFKFISLDKEKKSLLNEEQFDAKRLTSLIGKYAVDENNQQDFTYLMKNNQGSVAYFLFKATGENIDIQEGRWGFICDYKDSH